MAPVVTGAISVSWLGPIAGRVQMNPVRLNVAKLEVSFLTSVFLLAASGDVSAVGDVKTGRAKAMMCQTCHGTDGMSKVPEAPNIAGQTEAYLATQLHAFKSGTRKNDAMSVVAQTLADKDIEDLAAYFSAIEIKVVKIPGE